LFSYEFYIAEDVAGGKGAGTLQLEKVIPAPLEELRWKGKQDNPEKCRE